MMKATASTDILIRAAQLFCASEVFPEVLQERARQIELWGCDAPIEHPRQLRGKLAVLFEEVGEVAKAVNDRERPGRIREELVQVMAVCAAMAQMLPEDF